MSQFETNSQSQMPFQERSKLNSNRQLGTTNTFNGQNPKILEQNESFPQRSTLPNNYGNQQTSSQLSQYPQFNYPIMGQQTLKDQDQQEQIQKLTKENDTLKYQWRALEQENQKLKSDNIQLNTRDKSNMNEIQELQDQILMLKNENKRLTNTIQEDQYLLIDLQKMRKQADFNRGLESQINDLEQQYASVSKQLQEQKRQNAFQESELQNQKEILEKYKAQVRDQTLGYEQQVQKNEQLLSDNRKMKMALDSINKDLKQEQEQNQVLNQKLTQISSGAKDQITNLQKNLSNLNFQNEQLKNQVTQLQQKEKELQISQNQNIQQENKIRQMNQQLKQKQIEQNNAIISSGKLEYTKLATKCQSQDQEIWKLKEQLNTMTQQNSLISNKCTQLERGMEDSLQKSSMLSSDLKGQLEKWKNYGTTLEQEVKKRETAIVNLENDIMKTEAQLKQAQEIQTQLKNERTVQIGKLKEMHADLLVYEKKCDQLERDIMTLQSQIKGSQQNQERLEQEKAILNQEIKQLMEDLRRIQNQYDLKTRDFESLLQKHEQESSLRDRDLQSLRSQNSALTERNMAMEHELTREREKQLQLDSKIRSLENEIHNLNFQQTLKQQYSWNTEPQLSLGNQKPKFTEVSQGYQSPQANYQTLNSPAYNQSGIHVQSNQKPTEVSNSGLEHQRNNSSHQIKSKNYDLRFQNEPQNQLH
ncbi:unnamed protein product (macronuclear) [Paramecium tetraurelia]|uniref:Uncharacterized protein n=1 Tax=Paramecium tetraurelia TaxID=5888 RepID=A0CVL5_PARTE|nr:uncharacterized protein GSPATT00011000001 [Paramecium tetraurelia]CAK74832.1 unnamed protein product [Paramecium tetraurelia]|eukprot:XP_001442229.1 hypothetical protein (macronuclear) [Paramecium tetraurelia strain d4-2]